MNSDYKTMIQESEDGINKLNARIEKLRESVKGVEEGEELLRIYTKIKIYSSMVDDLIYAQYKMKSYV